jgi:hypothetical protein
MARPAVEQVAAAMDVLLTKRQIAYVKTQTFTGRSKGEIIRRLVNLGIDAHAPHVRPTPPSAPTGGE